MRRSFLLLTLSIATACASDPAHQTRAQSPPIAVADAEQPAHDPSVPTPKGPLTIGEARRYLLALINRDRQSMGLVPVVLDEKAAQSAGQGHAEDMAENGYLGHWGLDGSVPEQRFTEAGGADMVLENASCFVDQQHRSLDRQARIDPAQIEKTESMFFHETPPNDGHRKNILKPWHTSVGIGIAQPRATPTEIPVPCVTEEFLDSYGTYAVVPRDVKVGARIRVEGTVHSPAKVSGVGLARVDLPRVLTTSDANSRRSYPVPPPYATYWPPGYVTAIPLLVKGGTFGIDVPLDDHGKSGLYELSIWAKLPGSPDFQIVSLRTIRVTPREEP
jgi:uncharacterized protein YkwD